MTKENQTKWHKEPKKSRLPKKELQGFIDWLRQKHYICQICGTRKAQEAHHARYGYFGAKKDDRCLVAICRECHHAIHHGDGVEICRADIEAIGDQNWREYDGI